MAIAVQHLIRLGIKPQDMPQSRNLLVNLPLDLGKPGTDGTFTISQQITFFELTDYMPSVSRFSTSRLATAFTYAPIKVLRERQRISSYRAFSSATKNREVISSTAISRTFNASPGGRIVWSVG